MVISEWTDKDYAQAAIDMLPDTPEEIAEFLSRQKVKAIGRRDVCTCPINQWVSKWIDGECKTNAIVVCSTEHEIETSWSTGLPVWSVDLPYHVEKFIALFDTRMIDF